MTRPIVIAEELGKQYSRRPSAHSNYGVQDVLRRILGQPPRAQRHREVFWAVRDVSLTLEAGQSIGIIGVNGSGKTTLLRMIAGIAQPDRGRVTCHGHIQAIINLSAGMNPRLNGLENIRNALSLRGFSGAAGRERLDRIIAYAELEEFIEHPVCNYSKGMSARLAFATCVFLDPDLLIVDEALAVGDQAFKNKCFLTMAELKAKGVAMLFVSHSMGHIQNFCDHTIWLHRGELMASGPTPEVTEQYVAWIDKQTIEAEKQRKANQPAAAKPAKPKAGKARSRVDPLHGELHHVAEAIDPPTCQINGVADELAVIDPHASMTIDYRFRLHQPMHDPTIVIKIHRKDGLLLARLCSRDDGNDQLDVLGPGLIHGRMELADMNLVPGSYVLVAEIVTGSRAFLYRGLVGEFRVRQKASYVNGLIAMRRTHTIQTLAPEAPPTARPNSAAGVQ